MINVIILTPYTYTINEIIYFLLHGILVISLIYSIYRKFIRTAIHRRLTIWKIQLKHKATQLESYIKKIITSLVSRSLRPSQKANHHTLIVADSVHAQSIIGNARIQVTRGPDSWAYFGLAWTVLSVLVIEVNSWYASSHPNDISLGILILDIGAITYLCFYSQWFRNIIAWVINWRNTTPD